jgi:hypothetical protein
MVTFIVADIDKDIVQVVDIVVIVGSHSWWVLERETRTVILEEFIVCVIASIT